MLNPRIAVAGATGNVGRRILQIIGESSISVASVEALTSKRHQNLEINYREDENLPLRSLRDFNFQNTDILISAMPPEHSREPIQRALESGCTVIDNSTLYRNDPEVPLIIPEVNPEAISQYQNRNIIANPNCTAIQLLMAVAPLHAVNPVKHIVLSSYQSVSGAGKEAMDELLKQTRLRYDFSMQDIPEKDRIFPRNIAFNCIPQIGQFQEDGYTTEEHKIQEETNKILGCHVPVSATCVRVPVFIGHAVSANIAFTDPIDPESAEHVLRETEGIGVMTDHNNLPYLTPLDVVQEDLVFVSRIRRDPTVDHGLSLWIVSDNLRKGAALNAVQILELLLEHQKASRA